MRCQLQGRGCCTDVDQFFLPDSLGVICLVRPVSKVWCVCDDSWELRARFCADRLSKSQFSFRYAKLKSEIAIHRNLSHERVVKMYGHFEDQENVYILLELCPRQSLSDLLRKRRRFTEAEALYYMYDLIIGVKYLHHHRVLHRDLKLGNLFLDDNMKLKIGDFGSSFVLG